MADGRDNCGESSSEVMDGPPRTVPLSRFDVKAARSMWPDEEERQTAEATLQKIASAFGTIVDCLGDPNPNRDGLRRTPLRAAKALCFFTKGYEESLSSERTSGGNNYSPASFRN